MTIINGSALLRAAPLSPMLATKDRAHGVSFGLAEAGVDIRVKQDIRFTPPDPIRFGEMMQRPNRSPGLVWEMQAAFSGYVTVDGQITFGRFTLASSVERFRVPRNMVAVTGHKSTLARKGVNVWAGTTAEPGWEGWLTLEIGFHGNEPVHLPAGSGVMQVLFHELAEPADYGNGKYQGQADRPIPAILEDTHLNQLADERASWPFVPVSLDDLTREGN